MSAEQEKYRCREIMGNLHMLFGMDSVAVQEEEAFAHARNCPHCRANLQVAAKLSGFGRKLAAPPVPTRKLPAQAQQVRRLFNQGVQENRRRLANAYYEIGRSLILEGAGEEARIEIVHPIPDRKQSSLEAREFITHDEFSDQKKHRKIKGAELEVLDSLQSTEGRDACFENGRLAVECALRLVPAHEGAMNWLGQVQVFSNQIPQGISTFSTLKGLSRRGDSYALALNNLAWAYGEYEDWKTAFDLSEKAVTWNPTNLHIILNAFIFATIQKEESSIATFGRRVSRLSEEDGQTFIRLKSSLSQVKSKKFWQAMRKDSSLATVAHKGCPVLFE